MHTKTFLRTVLLFSFIFFISFKIFPTQHEPLKSDTYMFIHQFIVNINEQLKKKTKIIKKIELVGVTLIHQNSKLRVDISK